jgi:hypothetical protein
MMIMIKRAIFLTLLAALTLGATAGDYQYLVFTTSSGQQAVAASNLTLSISGTNLVVTSDSETLATIPLNDLTAMEFSNSQTTGISSLTTEDLNISEATEVYDMQGRRMPSGSNLPTGVYLMKINGRTIKVAVK